MAVRTMARGVVINPVLRRELVERMRSWRAAAVMTVYLALLSGALYLAYRAGQNTTNVSTAFGVGGDSSLNDVASVGRGIFEYLLFLMLILVLFLVPGQTSGAIAGERERQTLVPLQITLLRPRSIILGKIGAALAFLTLMIVATLPLLAVCYLIGGVSMAEVVGGVAMVLAVGLLLACLSTAISCVVKRVQLATVLSYGLVLMLVGGTVVVRMAYSFYDESRGVDSANPPSWVMLPNPLFTVADVVDDGEDAYNAMESPFDAMEDIIRKDEAGGDPTAGQLQGLPPGAFVDIGAEDVQFDEFGNPIIGDEESSFWWQSLTLLGVLALVAVAIGALRLRTPAKSER